MGKACKLVSTVDENVTEKAQTIYRICQECNVIYIACGSLSQSVQIRGFRASSVHIVVFVLIDKK